MMARGFMSMSKQQLSKFIQDKTAYIQNLENVLHMMTPAKEPICDGLNKTIVGDDVIMAHVNNDWRTFDDIHGTMKELNRQRCILLRATLIQESMCPHTEIASPSTTHEEAQYNENKKKD